jgi:hypothetical protein
MAFDQKGYYERNKERISAKRKQRYQDDMEYREEARRRAKEYKEANPVSKVTVIVPDEYTMTLVEAAAQLDLSVSTLRDWMKLGMYPKPALYGNVYYLKESQYKLLEKLLEFVSSYGARKALQTSEFAALRDHITSNWE